MRMSAAIQAAPDQKVPKNLGADPAEKNPGMERKCRGYPCQAAMGTAMRCAVEAMTVKVSSVGGDFKIGLSMSVIPL
jgi:hypothetical protein